MLDTLEHIETPEGVELALRPAGPYARALAWSIDSLIRLGVGLLFLVIAGLLSAFIGDVGMGIALIVAFILLWLYNVLFEVLRNGSTPGKRAVGLAVVQSNGAPVGWSGSILRNLLRVADFLPLFYALGVVTALLNRRFCRLGDLAAGTVVVHREPQQVRRPAPAENSIGAQPLRLPLSRDEQSAVAQFSARAPLLSEARRQELADILTPLTELTGSEAQARLHAHAAYLEGRT